MKYNIVINQKSAIDNKWNLDIVDLAIFDFIKSYTMSTKCNKMIIEEITYYWISPSIIIQQMPILKINTDRGISKRIDNLIEAKLLSRCPQNQSLQKSLFRFGENSEKYEFSTTNESSKHLEQPFQPPTNESSNNNNIYNNNIKEDTNVSKKENEIKNEDYLKFRQWMKEKCPFCNNPKNLSSSIITEEEFYKLKEEFTSVEIANVISEIENRKDLRKKYSNLYLTTLNWLKNNKQDRTNGARR